MRRSALVTFMGMGTGAAEAIFCAFNAFVTISEIALLTGGLAILILETTIEPEFVAFFGGGPR